MRGPTGRSSPPAARGAPSCPVPGCALHHPGQAASSLLPVEAEVIRPDGMRAIRRIIPFDSCVAGTCGLPARILPRDRGRRSSDAARPLLGAGASARELLAGAAFLPPALHPDNPWYVLQFGACGPPGASCIPIPFASAGYNLSTAPYLLPVFPVPTGGIIPNPNYPSPNPNHSNVIRHWANLSGDNAVQVYIVVPATQAAAASTDIFQNGLVIGGVPNTSYTYAVWVNDIIATFNKYASIPTAEIYVNVTPVYDSPPGAPEPTPFVPSDLMAVYDPVGGPRPAPFSGAAGNIYTNAHLIWDWSPAPAPPNGTGPTGNGFNEIIFLQNRQLGTTGMASMDLDPATGAIIECDVIFDVTAFTGAIPGAPILPNETTAFIHEIGHFFGLDHTNLHPGNPPRASLASAGGTTWPSWMNYSATINPAEYPGMVGVITGFPGVNQVAAALHPDDAAGASRIYPVPWPSGAAPAKWPLINSTAEFRGYLLDWPDGGGRFGDNVYPSARGQGPPLSPPGNSPPPVVGTVSGTARLAPGDVVGEMDTVSGDTCSGGFRIIGVPTAMTSLYDASVAPDPVQYDIVAEDLAYAGFPDTTTFGEWYVNTLLNPATNAVLPTVAQTMFFSNDGSVGAPLPTSGGAPGSPGTLNPGAPFVGSFSVWPGTVIEMGSRMHAGGTPQGLVVDNESRPLLGIFPRIRPTGGTVVLLALSNYPLNPATASLTVNGIPFSLGTPGVVFTAPLPHLVRVDIPVGLAGFLPPPGYPARLRLTASELGPAPAGVVFRQGINELQY